MSQLRKLCGLHPFIERTDLFTQCLRSARKECSADGRRESLFPDRALPLVSSGQISLAASGTLKRSSQTHREERFRGRFLLCSLSGAAGAMRPNIPLHPRPQQLREPSLTHQPLLDQVYAPYA